MFYFIIIYFLTERDNKREISQYFIGTAHCANMYPSKEDDLPHLQAARVRVFELIDTWRRL